ncbi:MAG: M12 family metallo-peptidase [Syntrophales bacterium]
MSGKNNPSQHATLKKIRQTCLLVLCILTFGLSAAYAAEFSLIVEPESQQAVVLRQSAEAPGPFKSALRWRRVALLNRLAQADGIATGDELVLNLFPGTTYHATIDRVSVNGQGTVTVRGRLGNYPLGYVLVTTTGDRSLVTIRVPELRVEYTIVYDPDSQGHYLLDHDPAGREKLVEAPPVRPRPPRPEELREIETLRERIQLNQALADTPATVDVLVVYTPAARSWAVANEGSIANTITQAMEKGQLAADNSNTLLTVNLVHSQEVSYTESGDSLTDLGRLQNPSDGFLDSVHTLRNTYGADLVVLLEDIEDAGGIGYLLESPSGEPAYGFSITRVQQASWTYTTIHEIGHNMGLSHHKLQNTEPGPGIYSYSAGWRWTGSDLGNYCSVMTYESGTYFADGIRHDRVAYFSNPSIAYLGTATGHAADGDNARTLRETKAVVAAYRQSTAAVLLYFPHVDTTLPWRTEIAVVNTSPSQTVTGTLKGYSNAGQLVSTLAGISLPARGRRQILVANEFANNTSIGYIVFEASGATVQGYTKFYKEGLYRAAVPAVSGTEVNAGDISVPHIDSSAAWWTGISLVNTTASTKVLTITFNTGVTRQRTLTAGQHDAFAIRDLFGGQPQPLIESAVITGASGVIGLELFGSQDGSNQLDGVLLTDNTTATLTYPHVVGDPWWTGVVAYNPSALSCTITITPYSVTGGALTPTSRPLAGKEKYVGAVGVNLLLPAGTAWFRIDSTRPLVGFELFGTGSGTAKQLAAYGGGGAGSMAGVFPKIEQNGGWTGIAFVNSDAVAASVTLNAYTDAGGAPVATRVLTVPGHAKVVNLVGDLFSGQSIGSATYVAYTSTRSVVGFQLNGSADNTLLDGLPGLPN